MSRCLVTLNQTSQWHQEQKQFSSKVYLSTGEENEMSPRSTSNQRYSHQKGTYRDTSCITKARLSLSNLISHTVFGILSSMTTKGVAGRLTNSLKKTTVLTSPNLKSPTAVSGGPLMTARTALTKNKTTTRAMLIWRALTSRSPLKKKLKVKDS